MIFDTIRLKAKIYEEYQVEITSWGNSLGGLSSLNFALGTPDGNYVLKQYGKTAARQLTRLEAIMTFLRQQHFCAPLPERTHSGELHFSFEGHFYALFLRDSGTVRHGRELTKSVLANTARSLASLHLLQPYQADLLGPARRAIHSHSAELVLSAASVSRSQLLAEEDRVILEESLFIKRQIIAVIDRDRCRIAEEASHFVHGDFHNENILYDKEGNVTCILDFEESFLGHGICDVINFIFLACNFDCSRAETAKFGSFFLQSYRNIITTHDDRVTAAIDRHMLAMASSTFLEIELSDGQPFFAKLLLRDIVLMKTYLKDRLAFARALF